MKKFLSIFLCCFLVFNSVAVPASAVKAEEVAVFEDAEGKEVRVLSYGVAPANAAAGVLYLTSTGGSMGAGVASIASTALPVLGYLLAAGVIVYSVYGLANCVMDMFNLLSASALAELQQIEAAGAESYTLSEYSALSAELPGLMESALPSGEFASVSFSVDRSIYKESVFSQYWVNGPTLPSSAYVYELGSDPVSIPGTSVSISLVEAPFAGFDGVSADLKYCFKVTNSVTGVSMYHVPGDSYVPSREQSDHVSFLFAPPVWQKTESYSVPAYYTFVIPVVRVCGIRQSGGNCSDHGQIYSSEFTFESNINAASSPFYFYFTGTNNPALEEVLFTGNYVSKDKTTLVPSTYVHPGLENVYLPESAFSLVLSDNYYSVGVTDAPAMPKDDEPIFLPPSVALDNANTLTQSGALTGTWDTTIDGEKVETDTDVPGVDTEVGFWESILNWLESFWDKFVSMLQAALMGLFVPSEGFFEQFIADISATFEDRMGILTYPISLVYEFCSHLLEVGEEEPIFRWPSWSYKGTEFLPAGSFNFNDILSNSTFKGLHDIYLLIVDAGIVFGLLRLAQKKYDSIINN